MRWIRPGIRAVLQARIGKITPHLLKPVLLFFLREASEDLPIFQTKMYQDPPCLTKGDGPIMPFRRWAAQFYSSTASRREQDGAA